MPELPEVETVRRALAPALAGRVVERVSIDDARLVAPFDAAEIASELEGERFGVIQRRGKYLIFGLTSGRSLVAHLRMTGTFHHSRNGFGADRYVRARMTLDDGTALLYRDVRRFGTWRLLESEELGPYLASRLGREPLERGFSARVLADRLAGRRAPIKAALLDQRTVAGIGNIYADEALWRARVNPLRPAGELTADEVRRIHRGVRDALRLGIARRGASLRDYRGPGGERGAMQAEFRVYGRAGEPCERCGVTIERTRVAGRGTAYCPRCQV